jgi:hypothetical protein
LKLCRFSPTVIAPQEEYLPEREPDLPGTRQDFQRLAERGFCPPDFSHRLVRLPEVTKRRSLGLRMRIPDLQRALQIFHCRTVITELKIRAAEGTQQGAQR